MNGIKLEDVLNKNVAINFKYESDYVKYLNYLAKQLALTNYCLLNTMITKEVETIKV